MWNKLLTSIKDYHSVFNILFAVINKFISGFKYVIINIIIGRKFGPEELGNFSYIISFGLLFTVFSEFRIHSILLREFSKNSKEEESFTDNELLSSSLVINMTSSIVGYLLLIIALYYSNCSSFEFKMILIFGLSYFFQVFRFLRVFYISKYKNVIVTKIESIVAMLTLISSLILFYVDFSKLEYFVFLRVLDVALVSCLLIFFYNYKKFKFNFNLEVIKFLVYQSLPLVVSGFSIAIFQRVDQIMLKDFINEYTLGQYSAAISIVGIVIFIPVAVTEAMFPSLVRLKNKKTDKELKEIIQLYCDFNIVLTILLTIGLMLVSPYLVKLVYGEKFDLALEIIPMISLKAILVTLGAVAAQIMILFNTHKIAYIKSVIGAVVNIILNYILIQSIGVYGAIYASLISLFLSSFILHIFFKDYKSIFIYQVKSLIFGWLNIIKSIKKIKILFYAD